MFYMQMICRIEEKAGKGNLQNKIKHFKDTGEKYKTYRGKGYEVEKKKLGEPCDCRQKCWEKFWGLTNYNIQNAYLQG